MATYEQAMQALRAADAAGNTEDAKRLAQIASGLKQKQTVPPVQPPEAPPVDFSASEMVKNIPGSAMQLGKDIYQTVRHPIDTAKGMQSLGQGLIEKALPTNINGQEFGPTQNEEMVNEVGKYFKGRYGGMDEIKTTLQNDPVGMGFDVGGVASGGVAVGAKGLNLAAKVIPKKLPGKMLSDALRMRPGVVPSTKQRIIKTMLDEGVQPTEKGIEKASQIINTINSKIDDLVKNAPEGTTFPRDTVLKYIDEVQGELTGKVAKGGKNQQIIEKMVDDFKAHMDTLKTGDHFTPEELQNFKKNIYKEINWKSLDDSLPENQTLLAEAKAAREGIETIDQNIKPLNRREGDLIEAMKELPSLTNKMENYRTIGMDMGLKTLGGAAIDASTGLGGVGTAAGVVSGIYGHPRVKSRLAFLLNELKKTAPGSQKLFNKAMIPTLAAALLAEERSKDDQIPLRSAQNDY